MRTESTEERVTEQNEEAMMLEQLALKHVGPAPEMKMVFAPRLNLITGDNGLGKTFILDIAWWALTRTWAALPAWPHRGVGLKPNISYRLAGKTNPAHATIDFDFKRQQWKLPSGRPAMPGIVIYARVGGGFSVWDPARNYWRKLKSRGVEEPDRPEAYHFEPEEVWNGLTVEGAVVCNGLIRDWVSWQRQNSKAFATLGRMLERLSPDPQAPLQVGEPTRVSIEDVRDIPTIKMQYGTVPLIHASAGIRRISALAYLLVWAWTEHMEASKLLNQEPEKRLILLFDEVETHLHPTWQRVLLPALLATIDELAKDVSTQVLAATHAPLIMASVETTFDVQTDRAFHLELKGDVAEIQELPWCKQGDAVSWLVSEFFGLAQARLPEAERAIEAAEALMRDDTDALPPDLANHVAIHQELMRVLPGHDPFWPRWVIHMEKTQS
jgi:hypothetical protein